MKIKHLNAKAIDFAKRYNLLAVRPPDKISLNKLAKELSISYRQAHYYYNKLIGTGLLDSDIVVKQVQTHKKRRKNNSQMEFGSIKLKVPDKITEMNISKNQLKAWSDSLREITMSLLSVDFEIARKIYDISKDIGDSI